MISALHPIQQKRENCQISTLIPLHMQSKVDTHVPFFIHVHTPTHLIKHISPITYFDRVLFVDSWAVVLTVSPKGDLQCL